MYLKSIEINGFKSFANKIVFEFPQGITGIVGPNGSGKSNIGDAVRWVLGEQSARQLRGSKMEDVIFSGTQSRRPMGFAYVAITFENANRIIPLDYEEVTVARRVYRSGESEYLINGSSCRRRDIVELFYDTGIGKEGYSIIGQGQVEKILSGKIEDSRELFDEAAGIAKYKKNRTVTEKSLEQERQNLERVTDILAELEKQVGPLEKQSAKAKEYLKLRDEEKDIDIHLFLYDYERLKKEQEENERQYKIVSGDLEDTRKTYEKIKEKNGKLQDQTQAVTESLETKESEKEELRRKKETKDNEILLLSHKVESNTLLITHYEELEKQSDEEKDTKTAEIEVLKKETVQKKQEISDGQKKLKKSKVLIIGAGGLGAPAALYLAGAGVGTIGIVDADDVSVSNLQRQIIHTSKREGTNKAESAKKSILELNEHIKVNTYPEYLYADNAEELFKEYDFIIDAVDNFETKFLINDTCVLLKKPFCHAGILQFQGQVMTYVPEEDQPCYRCIFEEIPESGSVPNCSQAGIIGAVAGIIGCIQALEAIKYLLGIGELLTGKMLVMDGLTMNTRVVKFPSKNKNCRVCGEHADIMSVKENRMEYVGAACPIK